MVRVRGDKATLDIFDEWEPPAVAVAFEPERFRGATLKSRLCHALKLTLADSGMEREEIAGRLSDLLGERISKTTVDAWVSEAKEDHVINVTRLMALIQVTGDPRILAVLAEDCDHAIVPKRYVAAAEEAIWIEREEFAAAQAKACRKSRTGGR